jgi:hypothetical protein
MALLLRRVSCRVIRHWSSRDSEFFDPASDSQAAIDPKINNKRLVVDLDSWRCIGTRTLDADVAAGTGGGAESVDAAGGL